MSFKSISLRVLEIEVSMIRYALPDLLVHILPSTLGKLSTINKDFSFSLRKLIKKYR